METKEKVEKLILGYDLSKLGINCSLPEPLRDIKLSQDLIDKYSPSFLERVCTLARLSCWQVFKTQNPDATETEFRNNFLAKKAGFEVYQNSIKNIEPKIERSVPLEPLKEFQRVQFLNLTKVDLRQIDQD